MARELFAIASMVVAAAALIGLFDFIERNLPDALGRRAAPQEAKLAATNMLSEGDGRQAGRRPASNANEQEEPRTGPLGRRY